MTDRERAKLMKDLLSSEAHEKLLAKTHLARARIWIRQHNDAQRRLLEGLR